MIKNLGHDLDEDHKIYFEKQVNREFENYNVDRTVIESNL